MRYAEDDETLIVVDEDGFRVFQKPDGTIKVIEYSTTEVIRGRRETSSIERYPTGLEEYLVRELIEEWKSSLDW